MEEWDYNELLGELAKAMGVELDEDMYEHENEMQIVGVKSAELYVGGQRVPQNRPTQIPCNAPIGNIHIDFDNNW